MRSLRRVILASVLLATIASAGMAAESEGAHDAKALELLRQVSDLFAKAQSLRTNFLVENNFTVRGETQKASSSYKFAMQRPNLLALMLTWGGDEGVTIVSDGQTLYTLRPAKRQYLAQEAPKSMPELSEALYASLEALDGWVAAALVADIISTDPYALWMDGVIKAEYLGPEKIKGGYCYHLRFIQKEMDWDMWLRAGDKPLPVQITFDMTKSFAKYFADTPELNGAKVETTIRCGRWIVDRDPPADTFKFKPPAGAKLVASFSRAKPQERQRPKEPAHPLVGLEAPVFEAKLLDGGTMRLADHIDKDIVILDFWASWCPPCRRALPILIEVAAEYADRGVVFYAVNQGEHPNKITQFLEKSGLEFPIPLDPKGRVGDMYRVRGIPQTVIIGKDGVVQVVHVGFSSDLKNRLSGELDALLTGEDDAEQEATTQPAGTTQPAATTQPAGT